MSGPDVGRRRQRPTPWYLIELLHAAPTVIAEGPVPRAWISGERAFAGAAGTRQAWAQVLAVIEEIREAALTGEPRASGPTVRELAGNPGSRLVAIPVIGPRHRLLGVWVTVRPASHVASGEGPPATIGFEWDNTERKLWARGDTVLAGEDVPRRPITSAEIFEYVQVENDLSLIKEVLISPTTGRWAGACRFTETDRAGRIVLVADGARRDLWRGIVFETARDDVSMQVAGNAALRTLRAIAPNRHLLLVDVRKVRVLQWITHPLTGVQWKGQVDDRDTPHPDDVQRIFAVAARVLGGEARQGRVDNVRLRASGGRGWVVVDGVASLPEGEGEPELGLIEITVVGHSDEPDPVPPTDKGHPGIGDGTALE
ncbi:MULTISPECIES: GAF domain-containing protein [Tsukamurella]|uniref:Rv3651-like N-terminal domain-containing protein n=1 Tax=Tsukamurella strandjordii TaxID=147577 RepID=A0AA90N9Y9_9ACTN|nr:MULTISPECIES: GAF domain-containing protein [Tsukamurella]MDP0397818.1 hypothetical protein [Tsukamurella strandjordii]GIZ99262.1 hypothetical protein TTY48_38740 [Tsukamurella sp. TY48]